MDGPCCADIIIIDDASFAQGTLARPFAAQLTMGGLWIPPFAMPLLKTHETGGIWIFFGRSAEYFFQKNIENVMKFWLCRAGRSGRHQCCCCSPRISTYCGQVGSADRRP
jgi:hypothetical protein